MQSRRSRLVARSKKRKVRLLERVFRKPLPNSVDARAGFSRLPKMARSDYREVVFEREGKEPMHGFMRVDRGMVIV